MHQCDRYPEKQLFLQSKDVYDKQMIGIIH